MVRHRLAAQERSRAIVSATIGVFARHGCSGATTRKIARAAGVSQALVFKHFPTKERLYRAILKTKIEDADRHLPLGGPMRELDDVAFFTKIATVALDRVAEDDSFVRLLLHSALEGHGLSRKFYTARGEKVFGEVEGRLRRMHRGGDGRHALDPALAARLFNGMIFAVILNKHVFGDRVLRRTSTERIARGSVRIFLEGVEGPRGGA